MRAYSTDFRRKVVQAYETGRGSQRGVCEVAWCEGIFRVFYNTSSE
jgi:hypothetical protein